MAFQFLIFAAAGLLVTWPSLNYPWFGDDLHLVRVFSAAELRSVWTATWDVDGIETAGYRPLTTAFNHARASVLGEQVAAQRLLMIVLCAIYLVLIGLIGRRFRVTPRAMLLAGVMMVCAKYSWYHLVWIADGVHLAQGVLFALAALAILRWNESESAGWWCASLLCFVLSVLVREDSLAVAPVLVGMAVLHSSNQGTSTAQRKGLIAFSVVIVVVAVAALLARSAVLPAASDSPWTAPLDLLAHALSVVTLAGWEPWILVPLFVLIFALLAAAAFRLEPGGARMACLWLCCAGVSTAPAIFTSRVNLLFFPVTFYCLFAADTLSRYAGGEARLFGRWDRPLAVIVAICCIAVPAYESRRQQLSMADGASGRLEASCDIARGGPWAAATPRNRRDAAVAELRRVGLSASACEELVDAFGAIRSDARFPEGVFVPPQAFLSR